MDIVTAREIASRIWCDPAYSHIIMNVELAEKIAHLLLVEANKQEEISEEVIIYDDDLLWDNANS